MDCYSTAIGHSANKFKELNKYHMLGPLVIFHVVFYSHFSKSPTSSRTMISYLYLSFLFEFLLEVANVVTDSEAIFDFEITSSTRYFGVLEIYSAQIIHVVN